MWSPLLFGCAFEALSGVLVLAIWVRLRKAEQESRRASQESTRLLVANSELKGQIASHEQNQRLRQELLLSLDQGMSAKCKELGALSERGIHLRESLKRQKEEAAERLVQERQYVREASARVSELEGLLERREEELHQRAATIERLHDESAAKELEIEAFGKRRDELEHELRTASERAQELLRREQEVRDTLSARVAEREARLTSEEESRGRASPIELLRSKIAVKDCQL